MTFLLAEIAVWLLGAAAIGTVLGAVISRPKRNAVRELKVENDELRKAGHGLTQRTEAAARRIVELESTLQENQINNSRMANLEAQLRAANHALESQRRTAGAASVPSPPPPPPPPGSGWKG